MKLAAELGIPVVETLVPREMLYIADEVFFSGTAAEITPIRSIDKITIGKAVPQIIGNDASSELDAVRAYNQAIALSREEGDEASADLLRKILKMEEDHVNWAEEQQAQITQMGLENYLARQSEGAAS